MQVYFHLGRNCIFTCRATLLRLLKVVLNIAGVTFNE